MSAADRREELEALLWRHVPQRMGRQPANAQGRAVEDILAAADAYAQACADDAWAAAGGQARLAAQVTP